MHGRWKASMRASLTLLAFAVCHAFLSSPAEAQNSGTVVVPRTEDASPDEAATDEWRVIYVGGQRIGYGHTVREPLERDGRRLVRTVSTTHLRMKRFGQEIELETRLKTREAANGGLLSFSYEMKNASAGTTRSSGRVESGKLKLTTTVGGRDREQTISLPSDVKSPAYEDHLLQNPPMKPDQIRRFKTFLPELNKVTTVRLAAHDYRPVELLDGREKKLLQVKITQSVLPTSKTRAYLDREGRAVKTETDFLGTSMITYTVPREEALKKLAGEELDVAVRSLVRTNPIPNPHQTKKVVYRLAMSDRDPAAFIPEGPTQSLKKIDDETVELTVTTIHPPEGRTRRGKAEAEYRKATQYLQSDDSRVRRHARNAAAGAVDPMRIALRMEKYVYERLSEKNFSTALASAAEVAKNLEGDCTEHAVLLAAMLRARDIPSRVVVGMVYVSSRSSFGGHMWTEAKIGEQWVPLDATRGKGGIGAAHIKLADSSFADDAPAPVTSFAPLLQVLGNVEIEVVSAE